MESSDKGELREFTRVSFRIEAQLTVDGQQFEVPETRDIGMQGIFLEGKLSFPMGTPCALILYLRGIEPPIQLNLKGEICRQEENGVAVKFSGMELDSYDHLQKLVMLNTQNADRTEQEFKQHVGLNKKD